MIKKISSSFCCCRRQVKFVVVMDQALSELNGSAVIDYHGRVVEIICRRNRGTHAFSIFQGTSPLDFSFTTLLLEMSIVLIFSQIMRFALKPLKQPKVICDIIVSLFSILFFMVIDLLSMKPSCILYICVCGGCKIYFRILS